MQPSSTEHIETRGNQQARLIINGRWLYGAIKPMPVQIFALNFDFYYDLDEGHHDESQTPQLNDHGEQYVVVWYDGNFFNSPDFPSTGYMTLTQAKNYAASVVQGIEWNEPFTSNYC